MVILHEEFTGGTSLTVENLTASTIYNFQIAAINSVGKGTFSSVISVTTTARCLITNTNNFVQSPIIYELETTLTFQIPQYITSASCAAGSTINYLLSCVNTADPSMTFGPI